MAACGDDALFRSWEDVTVQRTRSVRLWQAILGNVALVLTVSAVVFALGWFALGRPRPPQALDQAQFFDAVKVGLAIVAGLGAAVGLTVSYRRQETDEARHAAERDSDFESRFSAASGKLGDSSAAVRLSGVHSLAHLADDWNDQRQMCIDVLCAYVRLSGDAPHLVADDTEVRRTIVRLIRDHLQLAARPRWDGMRFDFTGARFLGGDFSYATFKDCTVLFNHVTFVDGRTSFVDCRFEGGLLNFRGATFASGSVSFTGAAFVGAELDFSGAVLGGGHLTFGGSRLDKGRISFSRAQLLAGSVAFNQYRQTGGLLNLDEIQLVGGLLAFGEAQLAAGLISAKRSNLEAGQMVFVRVALNGLHLDFACSTLRGAHVSFVNSDLSAGSVDFRNFRLLAGSMYFPGTALSGGTLDFVGADLGGAEVDLSQVTRQVSPPSGLPPSAVGLRLPQVPPV